MATATGIDQKTFKKICSFIYDHVGINLTQKKKALVQTRVSKRMRILGFDTFQEYFDFVEGDDSELINLIDAISTNVTHFFREKAHFEFLGNVLKEWKQQGQKKFRIWCAAASTGQEPYTIAITMSEALVNTTADARILATDISTEALSVAKKGEYDKRSVEKIPPNMLKKYFVPRSRSCVDCYTVKDSLKQMVKFGRLNLSKHPFPLKGPLDVIFCRNVMIYFDKNVRVPLLEDFYRLLKPGGYLVVGHSESLAAGMLGSFKRVETSIYSKRVAPKPVEG